MRRKVGADELKLFTRKETTSCSAFNTRLKEKQTIRKRRFQILLLLFILFRRFSATASLSQGHIHVQTAGRMWPHVV